MGRELAEALDSTVPMQRLLQGDVGSGKTVVALRAMAQVVGDGGQAALLAPTEVLAAQHHASLERLLGPLAGVGMLGGAEHATRVHLLTGSTPAPARRRILAELAAGEPAIVVGTHALLSATVQIPFLGLVVVDEQHRFGVEQRDALFYPSVRPLHLVEFVSPALHPIFLPIGRLFGQSSAASERARLCSRIDTISPCLTSVRVILRAKTMKARTMIARGA